MPLNTAVTSAVVTVKRMHVRVSPNVIMHRIFWGSGHRLRVSVLGSGRFAHNASDERPLVGCCGEVYRRLEIVGSVSERTDEKVAGRLLLGVIIRRRGICRLLMVK